MMDEDEAHEKFEKYQPINKRAEFKNKSRKVAGVVAGKLRQFKERNSDQNRRKRIVSKKLELEEESLHARIHKTKQSRKGKGFLSNIVSNKKRDTNPRHFGLQGIDEGFGAQTAKAGNADFGGLRLGRKGEGIGMFGLGKGGNSHKDSNGFGDLFGSGGGEHRVIKKRKSKSKKRTSTPKRDSFSEMF